MNKKFILIGFLILLMSAVLLPQPAWAASLVPCGGRGESGCQFCHLFVLLNNILHFVFRLVPVIAVLMLFFAGIKFFMAAENPGEAQRAKEIIKSVIIGLIIIYAAWAFIGAFLATIGLNDWTFNIFQNWWSKGLFELNCPGI